jgi:threonine dehydrogenase-like Zn-dependent dehydrogenase
VSPGASAAQLRTLPTAALRREDCDVMPRELIASAPHTPVLREYEERRLGATEIRVRTNFASPKHGTELVAYRDAPAAHRQYDPVSGVFQDRDSSASLFPRPLGNMATGTVIETGSEVSDFRVGDRVFGHWPIRETVMFDQGAVDALPAGLSDTSAVCLDPALMAFALRDARPAPGDSIAVFGLGAIGLFAVQLARLAGAATVIGVDLIPARRDLALAFGVDHVIDPAANGGDAGLAVRQLTGSPQTSSDSEPRRLLGGYRDRTSQTGNLGVDIAIEASGSTAALHQAIRATRFGGTVCVLSFYGGNASGLSLGEEFHVNQLTLISARSESLPLRDAPDWTLERMIRTCVDWLIDGQLNATGIITPVVHFDDVVEAYREIDEHPERSIKLGVRFD